MTREKKSFQGLSRAAIFIILEIAALAMLGNGSSLQGIWLNRASRRVQALLWGGSETLRNYFFLDKQNQEMVLANTALMEELQRYRSLSQSPSLPEQSSHYRFTPATVVKMSRNSSHNYIILDKGSEDGIKPESGIITDHGVVGFIEGVGKKYSYGITLMNSGASVSSRIGKDGFTGPLVWDGRATDKATIRDLPMHYDNHPGDTVYTSGFSSIFPPDIPVGTVVRSRVNDGSSADFEVDMFEDCLRLRHVTVVRNRDREEIESLEKE